MKVAILDLLLLPVVISSPQPQYEHTTDSAPKKEQREWLQNCLRHFGSWNMLLQVPKRCQLLPTAILIMVDC